MDQLLDIAQKYGSTGLVFLALGWFVIYLMKGHRSERDEFLVSLEKQHSECMEARKEATTALVNNTSVLSEIATIIKTQKS